DKLISKMETNVFNICLVFIRVILLFFFFQAEDGIRDLYVTGVQTCALPISSRHGGGVDNASQAPPPCRLVRPCRCKDLSIARSAIGGRAFVPCLPHVQSATADLTRM